MSQELAVLYQVQVVDTETARVNGALAGLDSGEGLRAEIGAAESELAALLQRHHETEKESLDLDLELKSLEEKRTKFQGQLYGGSVRNPRQLSDLQEEVQMLSREIGKVEDRMLELMDALEGAREEIRAKAAHLADLRGRLEEVVEAYEGTGSRLRAELGELEEKRRGLSAQVTAGLLKRYEQIRARQANLGLVKVTGGSCPGCHISLPSETLKALKTERAPMTCESCGRLLFWDAPTE